MSAPDRRHPYRPSGQLVPFLVVPQVAGNEPGQPEPTQELVVVASDVLPEGVQCTPQRRDPGYVALGEPRREAVEEKVGRAGRLSSRTGHPGQRRPPPAGRPGH